MKILKWIIAAIVLLVIVSGRWGGVAVSTLTQKQKEAFDRVDPESVPESVRKLPVDWDDPESITKYVPESVMKLPVQNIKEQTIIYNADYSFEARLQ